MRTSYVVSLALLLGLAVSNAAAARIYAVTQTGLYSVDPATADATLIGNHNISPAIVGIEYANGTLYGISSASTAALYKIDVNTGAAELVGQLGVGSIFEGGLAWDGQYLWGANQGSASNCNLVRIDISTGAGTVVGRIGTGTRDMNGLTFYNGQLYGIDRPSNAVWKIDRIQPGQSEQVGAGLGNGINIGTSGGLAGIYGFAIVSQNFFSIDYATGVGTPLAASALGIRGLALPEPGSLVLLALAGAGLMRRRG